MNQNTFMAAKILSVDDSKTIRLVIARALRPYDCAVTEATNGEEGLAAITREKPDLIILDITMPVMDGVTMLAQLKENEEWKKIPVLMLTAESGRDNMLFISKLGIRDYQTKPFKDDEFIGKISRIVDLQKKAAA